MAPLYCYLCNTSRERIARPILHAQDAVTSDGKTIVSVPHLLRGKIAFWLLLVVAVALWAGTRAHFYERFLDGLHSRPTSGLQTVLPVYLGLGRAVHNGHPLGQYDANLVPTLEALGSLDFDYRRLAASQPDWKTMSSNDLGFGLVVAAAWMMPFCKQDVPTVVLFAGLVDLVCLLLIFWIACRLFSATAGSAAALIYGVHPGLALAVTTPFYYYWSVPVVVVSLALLVYCMAPKPGGAGSDPPGRCGQQNPHRAAASIGLLGLVLAFGALTRSTNALLAVPFAVFFLCAVRPRRHAAAWCAGLCIAVLLPLAIMFSLSAVGSGKSVIPHHVFWHQMLCGLGNYDNPWGLRWRDEVVFERIEQKYGVRYDPERPGPYEEACKQEVLACWREHPRIPVRNFFYNLFEGFSVSGHSDRWSIWIMKTVLRALTWLGFALTLRRSLSNRQRFAWFCLLTGLLLYPVLAVAPICQPTCAYVCGVFPLQALLAGVGLAWVFNLAVTQWCQPNRRSNTRKTGDGR